MREKSKTILVSHKYKFVFIHNYKVAGTSVRKALCNYESNAYWLFSNLVFFTRKDLRGNSSYCLPKHSSLREVIKFYSQEKYTFFGLVRNPWDWEVSKYFYMKQTPKHRQYNLANSFSDFNAYVEWRKSENRSQLSFFSDESGELLTENIFKVEDIDQFESFLKNKFNIHIHLPKVNQSKRLGYQKYYDDESRKVIEDLYEEDISYFDYHF